MYVRPPTPSREAKLGWKFYNTASPKKNKPSSNNGDVGVNTVVIININRIYSNITENM